MRPQPQLRLLSGKTMWVNQGCATLLVALSGNTLWQISGTAIQLHLPVGYLGHLYVCERARDRPGAEHDWYRGKSSARIDGSPPIISTNVASPRFQKAASSVTAAGFDVRQILAATPGSYRGKKEMLQDLFGRADNQSVMVSMTAFEIALLISHKRALRAIALSNCGRRCV